MSTGYNLSTPAHMKGSYDEITAITDRICAENLNEEYAALCRKMTAALARKRPSPLVRGRVKSWAAGIVYAVARVNFLFDPSQTPHMRSTELCAALGVSQQTASGKAKEIWDLFDLMPLHPDYCLPSMIDDNPLVWLISVDGLIVDVRTAPRSIQEQVYAMGLIPYIPADRR